MPDRSNMRRVETTNDKEKRAAFKSRLVERITTQEEAPPLLASSNHIPVGSLVWHPDFGPCAVHSLSVEDNTITLTTETLGNVNMVLSVVESKLRPIDESDAPIHATLFTQLIEEPKREKRVVEDLALAVTLPTIYQLFTPAEQYKYLTFELHFTPEKASEFIFNNSDYDITWEALKPADIVNRAEEARPVVVQTVGELASSSPGVLSLPTIFKSFSRRDQVAFLRNTKQLTWDEVNDAGYGAFSLLYTDEPEAHQPFIRPVIEEPIQPAEEYVPSKILLSLHPSFNSLRGWQQKHHLTTVCHLTTDQAADFLSGDRVNFAVTWTEEVAKPAFQLVDPKPAGRAVTSVNRPAPSFGSLERVVHEVEVEKKSGSKVQKLNVILPHFFTSLTPYNQFLHLSHTGQLTPNEINEIIDGSIEVGWDDIQQAAVNRVDNSQEIVTIEKVAKATTLVVTLPQLFHTLRPFEQHKALMGLGATPEEAQDVLAVLNGKSPLTVLSVEIHWD